MQQGIEFHGRLSRSDRRPANPGQYDLLFQIFPKPTSQRVLWSETITGVEVRSGGFFDVVLGIGATPLKPELFAQVPRWLAVKVVRSGRPDSEHSPRVPLLGDGVRLQTRIAALAGRITHLEDTFIGEDTSGRSNRLRALPRRIQQLYVDLRRIQDRLTTLERSEEAAELARQLKGLAEGLARLSSPSGRLTRIEDELEDLVGPQGDVVDLNERMDVMERRILVGDGEGASALSQLLTTFQDALEEMEVRQERLERTISRLQDPSEQARALTTVFPVSKPIEPGNVVVIDKGVARPVGTRDQPIGVVLSGEDDQVVVAVGGLVQCHVIGPVDVGAILVAGDNGAAVVAKKSAPVGVALARALEPCSPGHSTILVRLL